MALQVRYMKEVTPYFQKAILLADFGWDQPSAHFLGASAWLSASSCPPPGTPAGLNTPNSEMKWTPLAMACLTKEVGDGVAGGVTLELSSPCKKSSIMMRVSHATVERWCSALGAVIDQSMAEAAATASAVLPFRVRKMGWATQVRAKT